MRRILIFILSGCLLTAASPTEAAEGRVIKVLPHFLDLKGQHALSPSLYDRDAYQFFLREHTNQISGVRFDVQWKVSGAAYAPLKLRVELRGTATGDLPSQSVLESAIKPGGWWSRWTSLRLTGDDYKKFGEVTAWRVTVWEGSRMLGEQQSFMW
jgi:hypothetical protein